MFTLLLVVGIGLVVSFVCSVLEAVLLSLTHGYIGVLQERGERAGALLARMRENLDEPIAAILTLNTISHTVTATISGAMALRLFGSESVALFSALLTLLILVISEILPKTIGARYWQRLATPAAYVLRGMILLLKPILVPLALFNRLIAPRGEQGHTISRAELEVMAEIGRREGTIDEEEWTVVNNVMNLDAVSVDQVMTPRTSMVAVPVEASVSEAMDVMLDEGHLRLPVYQGSVDRVVGILLARDLWRAARQGVDEIRELVRPAVFVPGAKPVEDLIPQMRAERIKMAIVLDEFGGTAGLVTLEDLIEEIIGEIHDEHEQEPLPFEEGQAGEVRISGGVPLWEVNERFHLTLPEAVYDTLGGYVFGRLGRIAEVGDEVAVDSGLFRVVAMDGRRIDRVAWVPAESPAEEPAKGEG